MFCGQCDPHWFLYKTSDIAKLTKFNRYCNTKFVSNTHNLINSWLVIMSFKVMKIYLNANKDLLI